MGVEPIASRLQGERTAIVLSRQMKGRVLIGSTRNPTSTSEAFHPSPPMLFILPYQRSLWLSPRSVICVQTSTSSHSRLRLLFVSYVVLPILHLKTIPVPVESNHPNLRALSTRKNFFMLSISIRPIVAILAHPRVRGTVKRRRGVFLRTVSNWLRSDATRRG